VFSAPVRLLSAILAGSVAQVGKGIPAGEEHTGDFIRLESNLMVKFRVLIKRLYQTRPVL
jgi:hypothetical protein